MGCFSSAITLRFSFRFGRMTNEAVISQNAVSGQRRAQPMPGGGSVIVSHVRIFEMEEADQLDFQELQKRAVLKKRLAECYTWHAFGITTASQAVSIRTSRSDLGQSRFSM